MSFAPSKEKSRQTATRGKKEAGSSSYRKTGENAKEDISRQSDKDYLNSAQQVSRRSDHESTITDRIVNIEKDISSIQLQQDSFRQLLELKATVDSMQNDNKLLHSLLKRTTKLEDKLDDFANRFDEYQRKTEQFLVVLDKNIDEESSLRAEENKKLKKVCTELERRQKEMDYEVKKDIKNTQIKSKEDLLTVASDIDKKADAHKEYLENHITAVHRALKGTLADDEEKIQELSNRLDEADKKFENKITKLDTIVMPNFDVANKRRKIDYADLKAWLLESIDERMKQNEKKLEDTVKKNYKSTVLQQKTEISTLKREITQLSEASPLMKSMRDSAIRQSNIAGSNLYPEDEIVEDYAQPDEAKSQASSKFDDESAEGQLAETIKDLKASINVVEKYTIDSGDEIGNKLDHHKISLYDWNDKIMKSVKKLDKLKAKKGKKLNGAEIKATSKGVLDEFNEYETKLNSDIDQIKELIHARKDKLVTDMEVIDDKLDNAQTLRKQATKGSPSERDKKVYQLKIELAKLDSAAKSVDQLKRQIEASNNYLNKEITSIETRLFTTKQMLSRDIESNLDA